MKRKEKMSSFPPDLTTEFLCRLAVKDVVRFRSVSKAWCSLINTPCFHKLHLSQSPNLLAIFQDDQSNLIKFLHLEFPSILPLPEIIPEQPQNDNNCIVGSCDGLVALCNEENIITLWNPFTRESMKLPQSNMSFPEHHTKSIAYGFGYDPSMADYKLLKSAHFYYYKWPKRPESSHYYFHSHRYRRTICSKAEVYSLKTNSWREIGSCPFDCGFAHVAGILVENALHWLIQKYKTEVVSTRMHREIVGFDLVGEEFYNVPILDCFYRAFSMTMAALDGRLSVAASYKNGCVDVWVMKEYGVKDSWIKAFSMMQEKVPPACSIYDIEKFEVFPLAYSRGADKLLVHWRGKLFWYDLESEEAEFDDGQGVLVDGNVKIITASLISLEDYRSEIDGKRKQIVVEDENSKNNKKRKNSQKEQEARNEDA